MTKKDMERSNNKKKEVGISACINSVKIKIAITRSLINSESLKLIFNFGKLYLGYKGNPNNKKG